MICHTKLPGADSRVQLLFVMLGALAQVTLLSSQRIGRLCGKNVKQLTKNTMAYSGAEL